MQKRTGPLPRSGGLASRSPARMNNSGYVLGLGRASLNEWDRLADLDALIQEFVEGVEAALERFREISSA
jgi:hypothetical protein